MKINLSKKLPLLIIMALISGCNNTQNEIKHLFEYEETTLNTYKEINCDSQMKIDGVADESVYSNLQEVSFIEPQSNIKVTSKAFLGESGLYLYTYVEDDSVYISSEKEFYQNDAVEYYIDPSPSTSKSLSFLNSDELVRTECVQIRANALGEKETWFGRQIGGANSYPWVKGYYDVKVAGKIDGTLNEKKASTGYSVEVFVPYYSMQLEEKPEEIGVMVAFNNVDNREDTTRKWFSFKGMSHGTLSSYDIVTEQGFIVETVTPKKKLNAVYEDSFYDKSFDLVLEEVDEKNLNRTSRAKVKAVLGEDGVYVIANIKDKVLTNYNDSIWQNDGIELIFDTTCANTDKFYYDGIYRFGFDIDEGIQTDICINGYKDYVTLRNKAAVKTSIKEITDSSQFNYKYEYTYEVMIPYSSLNLDSKPNVLNFAYAVKTPNEKAYIYNRTENQDWLWPDTHFPQNPGEYFNITEDGIYNGHYNTFNFPEWTPWEEVMIHADGKKRYDYRGFAANDGIYFNMVQYVNNYSTSSNVNGFWPESTHIEIELWNGDVGYGWGGTYYAFFIDGSYYVNNMKNTSTIQVKTQVIENPENSIYKYTISYEVYIGFSNNLAAPQDGPYGFIKFMSMTPGEDTSGYENSTKIRKDSGSYSQRDLWTDNVNSFEFRKQGIVNVDRG